MKSYEKQMLANEGSDEPVIDNRYFRNRPERPAVSMLVERPDVHRIMIDQLSGTTPTGTGCVYVLWGLYHSGKSTSTLHVAARLWDANRDVFHFNARNLYLPEETSESAELFFRRVMGFITAPDRSMSLAECFNRHFQPAPNHAIIIVDEADVLFKFKGCDELILKLAHAAYSFSRINLLLCFSEPQKVQTVLDLNGRTKIKLIGTGLVPEPALFFKWTKDELETFLVDTFAISERETYERLVELATRSGTPEVISEIVFSGEMNQVNRYERHVQTAVKWEERWVDGAEIVKKEYSYRT